MQLANNYTPFSTRPVPPDAICKPHVDKYAMQRPQPNAFVNPRVRFVEKYQSSIMQLEIRVLFITLFFVAGML